MTDKIFILDNLDCPHCASKIEQKINTLPEIENAVFTFTTKKLTVKSQHSSDVLIGLLQQTCDSIEDGVNVRLAEKEHTHHHEDTDTKKEYITLIGGFVIFAVAFALEHIFSDSIKTIYIAVYVIAYLILGGEILIKSCKNIAKGQLLDENFLMSIATLGAFAIQEFSEAVGVMLFFRIGELFQDIAVARSRSQIMRAVDLRPETVSLVKENDDIVNISAEEVNVGDILLVRVGDRIPLDAVVIEGTSQIDTSAVTGESMPIIVSKGSSILSGCINKSNVIKIRVEKVLEESMVTKILHSVENAVAGKPRIDNFITRFSRIYTPIVVLIAICTATLIPLFTDGDFTRWIYTALSFLVMSCPCALVLSVPLAFFCGIGASSQFGILFKNGIAMEVLAKIKCVVTDKTGTVTKGVFEVQHITAENGICENELLQFCASCEQFSTHPVAYGITEYAQKNGIDLLKADNVEEISGMGIKADINGQTVLCGNQKLAKKFHIAVSEKHTTVSGTKVFVAVNGKYAGCLVLSDTVKENAETSFGMLKRQNIFTALLTGDEEKNAEVVAERIGADKYYARLLPQEKLEKLQEIREQYGSVMFVGDGINDAPVLAGADVGGAMGSGSDSAIEVADVVFMNSDMLSVVKSLEIAKKTTSVAMQNVVFAITVKVIVMILGITGIYANMWLAVFADTGVAVLCILNSVRILLQYRKAKSI